jgi:hypothetical protein
VDKQCKVREFTDHTTVHSRCARGLHGPVWRQARRKTLTLPRFFSEFTPLYQRV